MTETTVAAEPIRCPEFNVVIPINTLSYRLEKGLEPVTEELNSTPLLVDYETWNKTWLMWDLRLKERVAKCREISGWKEFRPNASADCLEIFEKRGFTPRRKGKSGKASMDKEVLQAIQNGGDELAGFVIEAREAQTKLSQLASWGDHAKAGFAQAQWNQLGTPHGRYSCENPALQNRITDIRETVISGEGRKFVSFDLKQAEYVTFASLSKDPTLMAAFQSGEDFHQRMWAEILPLLPEGFSLHGMDPRKAGKTINFSTLYRMTAFAMAGRYGITQADAQLVLDAWFQRAPTAAAYIEESLAEMRERGYTKTHFGRVRFMPELKTATGSALHEAQKTAFHHLNAGTAAELLKIKQLKLWKAVRRKWTREQVSLVIQFHDELIFTVADELVPEMVELGTIIFQEEIPGFLPFGVDCRTGENWLLISK